MIAWCSFFFAAGPVIIITSLFCFAPYFCYANNWVDAINSDPIKTGLQSPVYRHSLVAGIAASIPPLAELSFDVLILREKSNRRSIIIIFILLCVIIPELISLILISPYSNSKLHICLLCAQLNFGVFMTSILLCEFGSNFWRNKLFTFAITLMYCGIATVAITPYFSNIIGNWLQKSGILLIFIGSVVFFYLSFKFLRKNYLIENSDDCMQADDFFCRFIVICMIFIMVSLFFLNIGMGLPYWTKVDSTYLTCLCSILSGPNIAMCVAFSHANRNEAYFMQRVRQMFVRYISHEMRTPLNTAVMGLQYLRSKMLKRNSHDNLVEILDEVKGSCEISVTILNEMLDYDKIQSGLMKLELEEVPVLEFLKTTLSPFYIQASHKSVTLITHWDHPALPRLTVSADKNKLAQVIRNLVSNALKFTPSGGTVDIVVEVIQEKEPQPRHQHQQLQPEHANNQESQQPVSMSEQSTTNYKLKINVIDTGVGVSKVNQEKLFKEIVQFSPGKLQSGGGSGLGLYISKAIMDLHGWTMSIASEGEGFGCTFSILLQAYLETGNNICESQGPHLSSRQNSVENSPRSTTHGWNYPYSGLYYNNSTKTARPSLIKVTPGDVIDDDDVLTLISSTILPNPNRLCNYAECQSYSDAEHSLLKVLVVDDSVSNRKMLIRLLRDKCSVIIEAENGLEATEKVKAAMEAATPSATTTADFTKLSDIFDAVLMDYVMPIMEGPEAARCMREVGCTGLIIGITGNVLPEDQEWFRRQGADIVLTKPVDVRDIDRAFKMLNRTRR